eukprot:453557_1
MSEKKKLKIKTTYNNDTRRFKGDINFQALVKFVESAYQIPCSSFRLTYIDEDEDQLTLDANEFVDAVDFYHGTGSDEVSFRVKTVVRKLNNIKSLYDQIDLVQDVYKDLKQCENNLKYKHNKASMMRTQYNKVKESVFKAECCIKEIKLLQTDINFRMIKILKIKTNDNKPITYQKMDKTIFFETKRQT